MRESLRDISVFMISSSLAMVICCFFEKHLYTVRAWAHLEDALEPRQYISAVGLVLFGCYPWVGQGYALCKLLSQHRAHRVAVVAVVVVHILVARIEVQVVRVVAAIRRRRPVVAVVALVVDIAVVAVASSRKEHAARNLCSVVC